MKRKVTPDKLEQINKLRVEGRTYLEIGTELGLATMTVYRHLVPLSEEDKIKKAKQRHDKRRDNPKTAREKDRQYESTRRDE
jgi:DNA invertase Pin-like site-specific DNA recombinase